MYVENPSKKEKHYFALFPSGNYEMEILIKV